MILEIYPCRSFFNIVDHYLHHWKIQTSSYRAWKFPFRSYKLTRPASPQDTSTPNKNNPRQNLYQATAHKQTPPVPKINSVPSSTSNWTLGPLDPWRCVLKRSTVSARPIRFQHSNRRLLPRFLLSHDSRSRRIQCCAVFIFGACRRGLFDLAVWGVLRWVK